MSISHAWLQKMHLEQTGTVLLCNVQSHGSMSRRPNAMPCLRSTCVSIVIWMVSRCLVLHWKHLGEKTSSKRNTMNITYSMSFSAQDWWNHVIKMSHKQALADIHSLVHNVEWCSSVSCYSYTAAAVKPVPFVWKAIETLRHWVIMLS